MMVCFQTLLSTASGYRPCMEAVRRAFPPAAMAAMAGCGALGGAVQLEGPPLEPRFPRLYPRLLSTLEPDIW